MSESKLRRWLNEEDGPLERVMLASQNREPYREPEENSEAEQELYRREILEARTVEKQLKALNEKRVPPLARVVFRVSAVATCLVLMVLLLYTVATLPGFGSVDNPANNEVPKRYIEQGLQETGAVNIVTGMILDYRAFDTLGESTVLFTAAMVVLLILRLDQGTGNPLVEVLRREASSDTFYEPKHDRILQQSAKLLCPVIWLLGIYVILNGHLSPGGGFSGGAVIGAGLILYVTAFGFAEIRKFFTYKTYQRVVLAALLTYAISKCYSFYTGANGIESIIPLGTPGAILSSGLILVLNICVGFIVTCTVYVLYAIFRKGEV